MSCFSSELSSLRFLKEIGEQRQDEASASGSRTSPRVPPPDPRPFLDWLSERSGKRTFSGPKAAPKSLVWARPGERPLRARRQTHPRGSRGHHQNQLIRVGCVLGTCQVQNLSHRLYQLIGQSGREDSSPMNPQSPHSYGWIQCLTANTLPLTHCLSVHHLFIFLLVPCGFCIHFHVVVYLSVNEPYSLCAHSAI